MPRIDFSTVNKGEAYPPLPAGKYLCCVGKVTPAKTRTGHEMWKMRFEVVEGSYMGRFIFDHMVFMGKGFERLKHLCLALGLEVSGELDLTPDSILGRTCFVEVEIAKYPDRNGKMKEGNQVTFAGFTPVPTGQPGEEEGDNLPF